MTVRIEYEEVAEVLVIEVQAVISIYSGIAVS